MEIGLVRPVNIDQEMQQAYLDYAMSVIVARALPDARDGLKPVHRRILYAMHDMGLRSESTYKKSARIVGEVLGKYHPHGDMAVYDAMARMAQDFSMRCLLVDGQGNFGSVDGDPPAAMRYTEARLASPAMQLLADIDKDTVDFEANFDDTLKEPSVLPAALPNLLVNGATGIAVGMSTSIPPHNLGEVVDALRYMLVNWEKLDDISIEDLMRFIAGPDFPTGGVILPGLGEGSLSSAYGTGRGQVTVQALAHLEEMERGRSRIIVTELPYMTNKASLIERIAELVRDERLTGITDLRDESDRQGMRIVIEVSKNNEPEQVLRDLYKHTPMQSTFSIIMLALVDGEPRHLTLKQALRVYLDHRLVVVRRRSEYELRRARERAHILDGLRIALKNLDEVIDLIRKAPDVDTARQRLMRRFKLTEIQATAILDMPLRRLAALERKKIDQEFQELQTRIKELEALLKSPKKMRQLVADELAAVKDAYGDRRRTRIVQTRNGSERAALLTTTDLTPEKQIWVAVTSDGIIWRTPDEKLPRQSGKEAPTWLVQASTRDTLYLAMKNGECAAISLHTLPEGEQAGDGIPLEKVSPARQESLSALFALPPKSERLAGVFILSVTRQGMLKKTAVEELPGPSAHLFPLVKINDGDCLGWLRICDGLQDILLVSANGMAIRFSEEAVRPMGLVAAGVLGMKLADQDVLSGFELISPSAASQKLELFLVASDGTARRTGIDQFPRQGRYGQGIFAWKLPSGTSIVGSALGKGATRATLFLEKLAPRAIRFDEAPLQGRAARGKPILALKAGDRLTGLVTPLESGSLYQTGEKQKKKSGNQRARGTKAAPAERAPAKRGRPAAQKEKKPATRKTVRGQSAAKLDKKVAPAAIPSPPVKRGRKPKQIALTSDQLSLDIDNESAEEMD